MGFQQPEVSVGILIGVRDSGKPAVLLQKRADHDSYARACQVTTHGKLTESEINLDEPLALTTAIGRKLRDELGEVAAEMVESSFGEASELERYVNSKGRLIVTFGVDLGCEASNFQHLIIPGKDVGGFKICTSPSEILPLNDSHKKSGVIPEEIRMFQDEIEAVTRFFSDFY